MGGVRYVAARCQSFKIVTMDILLKLKERKCRCGMVTNVWQSSLSNIAPTAGRRWTPMDNLLTDKDLETIARAHRRCREMEVERTMGTLRVRVSTCPATRAWSVPYLIRMERWRPGVYITKYFDSVEALREELEYGAIDLSGR